MSQVYDLRKGAEVSILGGHTDTPTSISLSPDGWIPFTDDSNGGLTRFQATTFSLHPSRLKQSSMTFVHSVLHQRESTAFYKVGSSCAFRPFSDRSQVHLPGLKTLYFVERGHDTITALE